MTVDSVLTNLARSEKYVSLTTFRRDGRGVATPVWLVDLGDGRVGFTTEAESGKVKRVRNNSKVTVQACDMRGRLSEGSTLLHATAEIVAGAQHDEVWRAITKKHGFFARFIAARDEAKAFVRKLRKQPRLPEDVAMILRPVD